MDPLTALLGPKAAALMSMVGLRQVVRPSAIGRTLALAAGANSTSVKALGASFLVTHITATYESSTDLVSKATIEMRGRAKEGYILGDQTERLPMSALIGDGRPIELPCPIILDRDEDYAVDIVMQSLSGSAKATVTFWGVYVR